MVYMTMLDAGIIQEMGPDIVGHVCDELGGSAKSTISSASLT